MRRDGRTDRQDEANGRFFFFFAILRTRLRSHSSRQTVVRRQKSNVTCVVTVLRSHKGVPWIDLFHVPLSRLEINFAGDMRFGLIAMV